ncbi:hypothetical protein [Quadrisphaera granulorum]|uniref:hypothetical protein n=1 Tax=Quadrisphaera granulorum TaxID=317664 RepID=UPI000D6CD584|nr:hypothetical protein [Quadrisphaera granulorum]
MTEHARHRAAGGAGRRGRALLPTLALLAAAIVVTAVVVERPPSSGLDSATAGAPRGSAGTTTATVPSSESSTTSVTSSPPAGAPASSLSGASATAQGAAQAAALWLAAQPPQAGRVAVDPALYDDVASSAQLASRLVPAPTSSTDRDVAVRWVVAGSALRAEAEPGSWLAQALATSSEVAVFGSGEDRVEVRELPGGSAPSRPVVPLAADGTTSPAVTSAPPPPTATPADPAAVEQLLRNPRLDFSPQARDALRSRPIDLRLAALLVQLAAVQPLSVSDLPPTFGASEPVRAVLVDGLAGRAVGADPDALASLERQLSAQDSPYRASAKQQQDGPTTLLRLELPPVGT